MSYASEQNQEHQLYSLLAVALFLKLTQSALGINETSVQEYVRLTWLKTTVNKDSKSNSLSSPFHVNFYGRNNTYF